MCAVFLAFFITESCCLQEEGYDFQICLPVCLLAILFSELRNFGKLRQGMIIQQIM